MRIWRIVRKQKSVKSFVSNSEQWSESHLSAGWTGLTTVEREELARLRREDRGLQEERDMSKAAAFLHEAPAMRFEFIVADKAEHGVTLLCRCCGSPGR